MSPARAGNAMPAPIALSLLTPNASEPDDRRLRDQLVFAFATGDVGEAFEVLVDERIAPPTEWRPADYERDLFLSVFLERAFSPRIAGVRVTPRLAFLYRVVAAPPSDERILPFRQAILRELSENVELRARVEEFYLGVLDLRTNLSKTGIVNTDPFERRLNVLTSLRNLVRVGVQVDASSGVSCIGEWSRNLSDSEGFQRLDSLLAYESNVAEIDVRLRIGFEGKIRDFKILNEKVDAENPFDRSQIGKWIEQTSLFLRGRKFGEHELFAHLMDTVFDGVADALPPLFPFVGDLEVILGALAFRDRAAKAGLATSLPTLTDGGPREIEALFNPLLLDGPQGRTPIPCDLVLGTDGALVVVTGPNSGGKTRLLQAVALTHLLAEGGFFVPAVRAQLPRAAGLFVSLIDHADPDQREGRLGTELLRIRKLFEALGEARNARKERRPLVVLDELCSGTNPEEGESIFRLVVKLLGEFRPETFVTTHFLAFAKRLAAEAAAGTAAHPALLFLRVELDAAERPTYAFLPGVAETSLAHRTAERLGVTEEALRALLAQGNAAN
jgi:DNA mismatch repair protein MutS2